jgi:hypothetical protein
LIGKLLTVGWNLKMKRKLLPENLGFCNGPFTVHTSRTMMFKELEELLDNTQLGVNGGAKVYHLADG